MGKRRSKRSRKSFEHYRRRRIADLKHALRCCTAGVLPKSNCEYLKAVLSGENDLPSPEEIAKRLHLMNVDRERHKLWTIPPIDMTKDELALQRKLKDRQRKMITRRKAQAESRATYLARVTRTDQPWKTLGIHKATWYRRKAKGETGFVRTTEMLKRDGVCPDNRTETRRGSSAPVYYKHGTTLSHSHQAEPPQIVAKRKLSSQETKR
jgi:hypothetical protein